MPPLFLPHLSRLFYDSPALIPAFEIGEVHVIASDSYAWREAILHELNQAGPVCAVADGASIDTISRLLSAAERPFDLKLAEIKHHQRPSAPKLLKALQQVSQKFPIIYIELDATEPLKIADLMFLQQGLLELRTWARDQQKLVLFLLQGDLAHHPLNQWLVSAGSMANSLSLLFRGEHFWHWDIEHWYSEHDVIMRNLIIDDADPGRPRLQLHHSHQQQYVEPLVQADAVWYTHKSVLANEGVPAIWEPLHHLDDWQNEIPENSPGCILLGAKPTASVIALAHIVHEMRTHFGANIRLFVREISQPIRHEDENLLLRAGATMIIPFELKIGRIITLIDNTAGWQFTRPILPTLERVLAEHAHERLQGYLTPQKFVDEVARSVDYAAANGIHSALVRAVPMDGLDLIQIAAQFQNRREGDVITIADGALYIYLFACRESDVDAVLKLLMGLPSSSLFEQETRFCITSLIQQSLKEIERHIAHSSMQDHTQAIAEKRETQEVTAQPLDSSSANNVIAATRPKPASWRRH